MDRIVETVNAVLREHTLCDGIGRDRKLREDLGVDSLRLVEILVALEEAFDVTLEEGDLDPEDFTTVADLYALMEKYGEAAV